MSNYQDGIDEPPYEGGGTADADERTAVQQQPYQQQRSQQQQFGQNQVQQNPYYQPQQGFGPPSAQSGYGHGHPGGGQYGQPYGPGGQQPYGFGYGQWSRPRRQFPIETKPFFLTSEFVGALLAILGIAITAASSDAFGAWRAWILITAVIVGYMVSRGIAKSGTRSHSSDPRENLDLSFGRGDSSD